VRVLHQQEREFRRSSKQKDTAGFDLSHEIWFPRREWL
jgi:hypothetical protein